MADERRSAHRARLSGVRVVYESATGERLEADVLDLSTGGLFIRTARPLPIGKRLSVEVHVIGEPAPWSALGRVVWTRESGGGDQQPPGMGVKLIDVDDAVVDAIGRLVDARERTEPGIGRASIPPLESDSVAGAAGAAGPKPKLPPRERTILGVGAPGAGDGAGDDTGDEAESALPEAPARAAAASPGARPKAVASPSATKAASKPEAGTSSSSAVAARSATSASSAARVAPAVPAVTVASTSDPPPRKRGGGFVIVLLLLAAVAATAYGLRGRIRARFFPSMAPAPVAPPPTIAPAPPPPPTVSAPPAADAPSASSSGSASASPSSAPSASASASGRDSGLPAAAPAPAARRGPAGPVAPSPIAPARKPHAPDDSNPY